MDNFGIYGISTMEEDLYSYERVAISLNALCKRCAISLGLLISYSSKTDWLTDMTAC